jgi:hypothetical protein
MENIIHATPLEAARAYRDDGQSVFPIRRDGTKAPAVDSWTPYRERLPTESELTAWYDHPDPPGIATAAGKVSGNSEHIDFDQKADVIFPEWRELVRSERLDLWPKLCVIRTPRQPVGFHVKYKCSGVQIPGNHRLAKDPSLPKNKQVLIETRGEGGYTVAPGSPACCHENNAVYEHVEGPPPWALATITVGEREILLLTARSFNREPAAEERTPSASRNGAGDDGSRPGDDYNLNGPPFAEIMVPHGWTVARESGGVQYLCRPGKSRGWSGTVGFCASQRTGVPLFACFSDNAAPFEGMTGSGPSCYSKFAVYALLNHNGDFSAAAKALANQGYSRAGDNGRAPGPKAATQPKSSDWGEPMPLLDTPDPPPFPPEVFSSALRQLCHEVAVVFNVPPDFPGLQMLGLASGAIGDSRRLAITPTHDESARLWVATVAEPGTGKSPCQNFLRKPLDEVEWRSREKWREELEAWKEAMEALKEKKGDHPGPKPIPQRYLVSDTTVESLKMILNDNPRGVAVLCDELNGLFKGFDQYKRGGNDREFYLSLWNHARIICDRRSHKEDEGGPVIIPHPYASVVGNIQPGALDDSIGERRRGGTPRYDGFVDRFLFAYPKGVPAVKENYLAVSSMLMRDWRDVIDKLASLEMGEEDGHSWPKRVWLTPDAKPVWEEFTRVHADEVNASDFSDHLRGPWSKLRGYCASLSLVVHLLRWASAEVNDESVDAESMRRAVLLTSYFKRQTKRVLTVMGADPVIDDARHVLEWIRRTRPTEFKGWHVQRSLQSQWRFQTAPTLIKPLQLLEDHHYVRPRGPLPVNKTGSRPPGETYDVNPRAYIGEGEVP